MITLRKSEDRGVGRHGWLLSYHTFSFAHYYDPKQMGYRTLRVINEDHVSPSKGFGTHSHEEMEIISYVLEGALAHRDSTGGEGVLRPGEVQRMSAGTGVSHSEFNASESDPLHFLQIWIEPRVYGVAPGYEQKMFPEEERRGRLQLIVSPNGEEGSLHIHQDARIYSSVLASGQRVEHSLAPNRFAWLQVARGEVELNGVALRQGDGAAVREEAALTLAHVSTDPAEILLFDLD
ncbi:MAG TPA: pirin family protein [Thermoanaerobaculia bacterium]